jgi:prepilin-type processing-associated H-X9-DG protein
LRPYLGTGRPCGGTHFEENTLFGRGRSIGCNTAMADGSVRFVQESIAPHVLEALTTAAGGEEVADDW